MLETELNISLIPYKNKTNSIEKYHVLRQDSSKIIYKICNVFAPFGRQIDHQTKCIINQHRLNICFSKQEFNDSSCIEIRKLINELELYFSDFDELTDYKLISNIIDRDTYGIVIRFHLKTNKNNTVTPLIQMKNLESEQVEWISFDKENKINIDFSPDSLWINHTNKTYGISLVINKVFQYLI